MASGQEGKHAPLCVCVCVCVCVCAGGRNYCVVLQTQTGVQIPWQPRSLCEVTTVMSYAEKYNWLERLVITEFSISVCLYG